jgi:hypothetical protein
MSEKISRQLNSRHVIDPTSGFDPVNVYANFYCNGLQCCQFSTD